jgi:hypothetical protein
VNHGKGKQQATENTRQLAQAWIDAYKAEHPGEFIHFGGAGVQADLF